LAGNGVFSWGEAGSGGGQVENSSILRGKPHEVPGRKENGKSVIEGWAFAVPEEYLHKRNRSSLGKKPYVQTGGGANRITRGGGRGGAAERVWQEEEGI